MIKTNVMKKIVTKTVLVCLLSYLSSSLYAQTASTSDNLVAQPIADRLVLYDVTDPGVSKTVRFGADLAWDDEQNFRRCILFMGKDQVDVVRVSHQPADPLVNGTDLTQLQLDKLNHRLYLLDTYLGSNSDLVLNCDHSRNGVPYVDGWYRDYPDRWAQLIKVSAQKYIADGHQIITVSPFNEPDFGWDQFSGSLENGKAQFKAINTLLRNDSFFDNMRISGGNTLNCDFASPWYDYLKDGLDEGNTHQLAGNFDTFASFLTRVRANGDHATLDEMHNVVEGLVGYEYGMQTGIWWGPCELARGEMVKAFDGQRIGYAEHRTNWTAAAVYRTPEGTIKAFGGTSERQAATTTYNYISKDRAVYYDGVGPQREFVLEMPGGAVGSYQNGQTNAERVINITWGDDIQPVIGGQYKLVNRGSGQVLEVAGDSNGADIYQASYTGSNTQKWDVTPVSSRVGGDFSYYYIKPASSTNRRLDLWNFSLNPDDKISLYDYGGYRNQQWYLDYADDGYFYIRSGESSYCAEINGSGNLVQGIKAGNANQQWRLLPVDSPIEFVAPAAPTNLMATANASSIQLDWTASPDSDVAGYSIFRSETASGPYNTIARHATATSFVDNTTLEGVPYYYVVKAVDQSLNRSDYSNEVSGQATGANNLIAQYNFDGDTKDSSINLNHGTPFSGVSYVSGIESDALSLNGSTFVKLPADIANHQEITVAAWVNSNGGNDEQYIFDFSNGEQERMFLASNKGSGTTEFSIVNGGGNQTLSGPELTTGRWMHVAITLGASGTHLYVNGQLAAESTAIPISPLDFKPVINYIGRSPNNFYSLFNGKIDDFRVYNYELSASEIAVLGANEPPVAVADGIIVSEGGSVTSLPGGATSVLANDTDRENDPLTAILVSNPTSGTLTLNSDGTFSYTHDGSSTTSSSFTYKANDGNSDSNVVTVNIAVTPFALPYDNFNIESKSETCLNRSNGELIINATENYDYYAVINGTNYDFTGKSLTVSNLAPGSYTICIYITGKDYEQCYAVTVEPGGTLIGSVIGSDNVVNVDITEGTPPFEVFVNGQSRFGTNEKNFNVNVQQGDFLEVKTAKACEGVLAKLIEGSLNTSLIGYPNPTNGIFNITTLASKDELYVEMYTLFGQLISKGNHKVIDGNIQLNLERVPAGIYISKVYLDTIATLTIIKK